MRPVGFVCAWCDRVRTADGQWQQARDGQRDQPHATHGICPECLARETGVALAGGALHSLSLDEGR